MQLQQALRYKITYSINGLQERVTQNIKSQITAALDASISHSVASVGKGQVLLLNGKLLVADGKRDDGKLIRGGAAREDIALLSAVIGRAWDGIVDGLAGRVGDESKRGSRVGNGSVTTLIDRLTVDSSRGAVELPEALRVVHRSVVWLGDTGSLEDILIDVAKGVKGLALVWVVGVLVGAKVGSEQLLVGWDVLLSNHVLYRCLGRARGDGVDGTESEPQ